MIPIRHRCRACDADTSGTLAGEFLCSACYGENIHLLGLVFRPCYECKPKAVLCGARDWRDTQPILKSLRYLTSIRWDLEVIHGGARGADSLADLSARKLGITTHVELANWIGKGRGEGYQRNARMLALRPDIVLAFKDHFDFTLKRGGTEHMCRIALKAHVPVYLYQHETGWRPLSLKVKGS